MTSELAPALRATGLRKTFRSTDGSTAVAVDDIDLIIHRGDRAGVRRDADRRTAA